MGHLRGDTCLLEFKRSCFSWILLIDIVQVRWKIMVLTVMDIIL